MTEYVLYVNREQVTAPDSWEAVTFMLRKYLRYNLPVDTDHGGMWLTEPFRYQVKLLDIHDTQLLREIYIEVDNPPDDYSLVKGCHVHAEHDCHGDLCICDSCHLVMCEGGIGFETHDQEFCEECGSRIFKEAATYNERV